MVDLTDFRRYKIIYLFIILFIALLFAFRSAPLFHEVFVDITANPPEEVRKTDFSWIATAGWFNTQGRLINSPSILEGVKSSFSREELKKIVSAQRLGVSDIIRITVRSKADTVELKRLANDIANLYLNQLNNPDKGIEQAEKAGPGEPANKSDQENKARRTTKYNSLTKEGEETREKITAVSKRLEGHKNDLKLIEMQPMQLKEIKRRIDAIDKTLIPLKLQLAKLRATYTDNWPSVADLKAKADILESEKQKLNSDLSVEQELEDKKADIINKIKEDEREDGNLQNELKKIESSLIQIELEEKAELEESEGQEETPKEGKPINRIISPATEKTFSAPIELGIRVVIAVVIGVAIWFLLGLALKNAYLFWVLRDRFFRNR